MLLPIAIEPNPILHKKSQIIDLAKISDRRFKKLMKDLAETMYTKDGVGMAAPQVGESVQLCIIHRDYNPINPGKDLVLINPTWEKTSIFKAWDEEGCLSVPGIYGKVKRYKGIKVKAYDEQGKLLNFTVEDFPARIIQHEIDHLQGILFIEKAKELHEIKKEL